MLEKLSKHTHFCFLDGYSGFSQIHVSLEDQEKTTFTCPFGTYAYRRMPFGLVIHLLPFKHALLLYSLISVRKLLRYSWMIFPYMELLLMTV